MAVLASTLRNSPGYDANRAAGLEALEHVRELAEVVLASGGPRSTTRHRERGKLLARDRIDLLLDEDAPFLELSAFGGAHDPSETAGVGVITGIGPVSGVECVIVANQPTVKGGTMNPTGVTKQLRALEIAARNRLPVVSLVESGGADLPKQADIFVSAGKIFHDLTRLSASGIPTIALVFGNATAGGAYVPGMSEYTIFVRNAARVFLGGPPLVKMAINEDVDEETLGGADMHARESGLADYLAADEHDAIRLGRQIVADLRWRKLGPGPSLPADEPLHDPDELLGCGPADLRRLVEARELLARVLDGSRLDEFQAPLRDDARGGLGLDLRLPRRRAREQRDPLLRGIAEGRPLHPVRERPRYATPLRPEHHRLHGRERLRTRRDHQGRCQADQRGRELGGAPRDADGRRLLRRWQLRDVREGPRPALRLHVAESPDRGDGRARARRGDVDRPSGRRRARRRRVRFGERIAHGVLGLSIVTGLISRLGIIEGTTIAFLGLEWSFRAPIVFGDTITARSRVADKRETSKPDRGIVIFSVELVNQRGEVVQEGKQTLLMRRR